MALYDFLDQDPSTGSPYSRPRPAYQARQAQQATATNYLQSGPQRGTNAGTDDTAQIGPHGTYAHRAGIGVGSYIDAAGQWLWDRVSGKDNPASFDEDVTQARGRLEARAHARPTMAAPSSTVAPGNDANTAGAKGPTIPSAARGTGMGQLSDFGRLAQKAMSQGPGGVTVGHLDAFGQRALQAQSQIYGESPTTMWNAQKHFEELNGRFATNADITSLKAQGKLGQYAEDYQYSTALGTALNAAPSLRRRLPYQTQTLIGRQLFTPSTTAQGVANLRRAGVSVNDIRKVAAAIGGGTGEYIASFLPESQW